MKLEFEYLPIDSLTPYEKNARKHGEFDVTIIKKSIEEFGFNDPIGIWGEKNIIVEGHGRLLAAKELGMSEVPVIRLDHLNDQQRKMYALEHNRSAEMSTWDLDTLIEELDDLKDFDLSGLGFEEFLLDSEENGEVKDDDFDEKEYMPEKAYSQIGDIYVLGKHRFMCGDSTNPEHVNQLINGEKVWLLLTDPPYNVNYEGQNEMTLKNDDLSIDKFEDLLTKAFRNAKEHMEPGSCFYVWLADRFAYEVIGTMKEVGWEYKQILIWKKSQLVLGGSMYQYIHEPCLFGWNDGACHWMSDRKQVTVFEFDKPKSNDLHPTMKPVELFAYLMKNSSRKDELVLDLFGGSGTTIIAAEQTGRKAAVMELEPRYADVTVKRYLRLKGSAEDCYMIRNGEKQELPEDFTLILG